MTALNPIINLNPDVPNIRRDTRARISDFMEIFQRGIVTSIAAAAGFGTSIPNPDNGVDIQIQSDANTDDFPQILQLQLKATSTGFDSHGYIHTRLSTDRYNQFCKFRKITPRLIVIMDLPRNQEDWYHLLDDDSSLIKNSCYWVSIMGYPQKQPSSDKVDVKASRANHFDDATLCMLMAKIRGGMDL
ncbi:DUF4365 domain-containing protein [Bifidobacterium sp. ESL0745]|uniref:DUF4365 domain-containing protein n=1 Tax=Bifidobacterium sp. ESL0745 TaxID=2983226 RepID=UPI0023F8E70E|nr:DUF4365 domain-containing protein [Bifidobacterium sp. ESL0745]MDF7665346.1 DUF4365 domain-containing protein [Bifidobacterium sp. ESL0745]